MIPLTERREAARSLEGLIRNIRLLAFDFDGVFTDNKVYVAQDGTEMVCCTRADGIGVSAVQRLGLETLIISTETNPVVAARAEKIRIRCLQGIANKREAMDLLLTEFGIALEQVAFVGNDVNDLPLLTCVGFPITTADAHPDVADLGKYRTRTPGGQGAVREVCDLFTLVLLDGPRHGGARPGEVK
jgi:YrbI family 3-deoxy-D-manno-octulosonate 8-phosphate phosphatase